jgi:hypothetical protein
VPDERDYRRCQQRHYSRLSGSPATAPFATDAPAAAGTAAATSLALPRTGRRHADVAAVTSTAARSHLSLSSAGLSVLTAEEVVRRRRAVEDLSARRNALPETTAGDKPYKEPEYSPGYFPSPNATASPAGASTAAFSAAARATRSLLSTGGPSLIQAHSAATAEQSRLDKHSAALARTHATARARASAVARADAQQQVAQLPDALPTRRGAVDPLAPPPVAAAAQRAMQAALAGLAGPGGVAETSAGAMAGAGAGAQVGAGGARGFGTAAGSSKSFGRR